MGEKYDEEMAVVVWPLFTKNTRARQGMDQF